MLFCFEMLMKYRNPLKCLTKFEKILWAVSVLVVTLSFLLTEPRDYLTLTASLIGVSALIFVAKGMVVGQLICVFFAVFYGIISFHFRYYGEMITYLGMSAPASVCALISWLKHPFADSNEVKISKTTPRIVISAFAIATAVTIVFYFILGALNTENLFFSVLSVFTSVLAAAFTYMRSPYYAIAYAANDIVLIVLWILATIAVISYLPMIFCFVMFLFNDTYGFINWKRLSKKQDKI